jgi:hypothetical protein
VNFLNLFNAKKKYLKIFDRKKISRSRNTEFKNEKHLKVSFLEFWSFLNIFKSFDGLNLETILFPKGTKENNKSRIS